MNLFAGKTAIVTGASCGIGLGIAERLVRDGARVVITARNKEALDESVESFGRVDFLVNNPGINPTCGPMVDLDLDAARRVVEVNCLASLSWCRRSMGRG